MRGQSFLCPHRSKNLKFMRFPLSIYQVLLENIEDQISQQVNLEKTVSLKDDEEEKEWKKESKHQQEDEDEEEKEKFSVSNTTKLFKND